MPTRLENLEESVRARVCDTCPYRTRAPGGGEVPAPRPCESDCPVFHALPILEQAARNADPMLRDRREMLHDLLSRATQTRTHAASILRRHSKRLTDAILEQFHD